MPRVEIGFLERCLRIQRYKCRLLINQTNIVVSLYLQNVCEFSHAKAIQISFNPISYDIFKVALITTITL